MDKKVFVYLLLAGYFLIIFIALSWAMKKMIEYLQARGFISNKAKFYKSITDFFGFKISLDRHEKWVKQSFAFEVVMFIVAFLVIGALAFFVK